MASTEVSHCLILQCISKTVQWLKCQSDPKFINESFYNIRCLVIFITAVCLLFLLMQSTDFFSNNLEAKLTFNRIFARSLKSSYILSFS